MIKRIRFVSQGEAVNADSGRFAAAWRQAAAGIARAPGYIRPLRVTVCLPVPAHPTDAARGPRHDAVGLEWFRDVEHLREFLTWLGTPDGRTATEAADGVTADGTEQVIITDERVLRGADWLKRHRQDGGGAYKHMALALRDPRLTPEQFSRRWAGHSGRVRTRAAAPAAVIPEDVRGLAYVQNHPLTRPGDWVYDAVNEVYFDDLAGLRARDDWFRRNAPRAGADLVRASWFLSVREEVLFTRDRPAAYAAPGSPPSFGDRAAP